MNEAIDYTALSRVRHELNEKLYQARQCLEAYSEAPEDVQLLHECMTSLHQVRGPLQIVDLQGADRLVAEMEASINALIEGRAVLTEDALDILMEVFIQLPDYLSRLGPGQRDVPVALLPLINRLRDLCDEEPLSESAVFTPDLTKPVPSACFNSQSLADLPDVRELAHTYRQRFQSGLVEWYRGGRNGSGLRKLHEVLANLQQASRNESMARLWWFGAGLAEALTRGAMPASTEIKQLFGHIDRQIKRLIDVGETAFSESIPEDLLKQLLFYILQSDISAGRVADIREVYAPSESDRRAASESLSGFNEALFSSVSAGACERVEQVKDRIDAYMHAGPGEATQLKAIAEDLHELGNIVGMIGLDEAGTILAEQEHHVRSMLDDGQSQEQSGLMPVANALLDVEAVLREINAGNAVPDRLRTTRDIVYRQGLEASISEIVDDMAGARERIDSYIRMPALRDVLADVPQQLDQISAGLLLASEERAAALVLQVSEYVSRELIEGDQVPGGQQLDTLADAICSLEYYVEGLNQEATSGGKVLDVAEQSLEKLGYYPPPDSMRTGVEQTVAATLPAVGGPVMTEVPEITALQVIADDVDREILDIFIEEATGEISLLDELIPRVLAGTADGEMLETIRRAFHTLKGSGRMVGALALGEFACVFERLLKQLIDGTAGTGKWHHELLAQVSDPLSQLLEQIKSGPAPGADVNGLVMQAVGLMVTGTMGNPVSGVDERSGTNGQPDGRDDEAPAGSVEREGNSDDAGLASASPLDELPVLTGEADPEIVEIFMEEAADQLAVISVSLPEWLDNPGNQESLISVCRAFHTLKGSGRMAGAMIVGEYAWAIESLLRRVIDGSIDVNAELMEFLGKLSAPLTQLLDQVGGGPEPTIDYRAVMETAQQLEHGESITPPASRLATDTTESRSDEADIPVSDVGEVETELMDIFGRECRDHLDSMREFISNCEHCEADLHVTEPLYRALHTLSGIADSARVAFIRELAGELYTYFGTLEEAQKPLCPDAVTVLKDSTAAMSDFAGRLPDTTFDAALLQSLLESIHALPPVPPPEDIPVSASYSTDIPEGSQLDEACGSGSTTLLDEMEPGGENSGSVATSIAGQMPAVDVDHYADLDPELFEVFLEEAGEIIEGSEATLHSWVADPGRRDLMNEFQRQLHTLKGGARMVDITAIGNLSHSLESLLTRIVDGQVETSDQLFTLLRHAHDRLADMLETVRARGVPENALALEEELSRLGSGNQVDGTETVVECETVESGAEMLDQHQNDDTAPDTQDSPVPVVASNVPEPTTSLEGFEAIEAVNMPLSTPETDAFMPHQPERRKPSRVRGEQVRVQAELLDNLVNYSGEISIYRARLEQQIGVYRFNLAELHQTINRVRDQLRQFEIETETQILHRIERETEDRNLDFDPLEMDRYSNLHQLSRSLVETISDLHSIQELLDNTTRETEALLLQQSRVSTDLQEGLMHARMIPFAGLAPRLRRIVRQSAGELDKSVELTFDGAEGEMDRNVIERIIAPLEHMLRNAVDHGIEQPDERKAAGKPETGNISIAFHREGPEVVLQVADDGRGINHDTIRERAVERGLIAEDAQLSDSEVMQFVLQTGFSTADRVTQISGRGVGMDVVNSEVKQLGGSLLIDSTPGQGSVFTIRLPYTLASNQALLVRAGEDTFCIPLGTVEGVVRVDPAYLAECYQSPDSGYRYAGNHYQLHHLGTLLKRGSMNLEEAQGRIPVLLVRIGEKRLALQVEALIGNREIVIKPLGTQLSGVHGVSGATILGDGRVIFILDMAAVARMAARPQAPASADESNTKERLLVMVVDDSITVRKVTTRLLERYGFDVVTAKDGVDAMSLLQDRIPDIMLLDIEMPRMDGFELARHVRNDERLRHIPITMITSRTGDKHRERAMQIGVNHYLGKPFQEHELLKTIHRLIGIPMTEELEQADVCG